MRRFRLLAVMALMAGLLGQLPLTRTAEACSLLPDTISVRDTPANGVVVVDVMCTYGHCIAGGLPSELPVMDKNTGELVPGTIVHVAGALDPYASLFWKPDAGLVAGNVYEVLWQPDEVLNSHNHDYDFQALPDASWSIEDIAVSAGIDLEHGVTDSVSCEVNEQFPCGRSDGSYSIWVPLDVSTHVALHAEIAAEPQGANGQYIARMALWGSDDDAPEPTEVPSYLYTSLNAYKQFRSAFDAYCYRVELESLIDGAVAVTEDCIEHDLGELTVTPRSESEIAYGIASCSVAPEGYAGAWCAGKRARCDEALAAGVMAPVECEDLAAADCDDVEPNEPVDPMEPSDPNDPPSPNDPPDPIAMNEDPSDGEEEDASAEPGLEGGCSTSMDRGRPWSAALFTIILLALRARRRTGGKGWRSP